MPVFICESAVLVGDVSIGAESVVLPQARLSATGEGAGRRVVVGERNIIEDKAEVEDSELGHANVLSVGCSVVRSKLGSFNTIGLGSRLEGCTVGNLCVVAAGVCLTNVELADNTTVYLAPSSQAQGEGLGQGQAQGLGQGQGQGQAQGQGLGQAQGQGQGQGSWAARVVPPEALRPSHEANEAYHKALTSPASPQFVGRGHHALRP